jgi:hypothetical protein
MQWRLAYKDEVKELRAKLGSHVATINLLLMTQAVSSITAAENDREEATCGLHEKIRAHRMLLDEVKSGVDSSLARQLGTKLQLEAQANTLGTLNCKADQTMLQLRNEQVLIDEVKKAASKTEENTKSLLVMATDTLSQATLGLLTLRDIAVKLCYLAASITKFTVEMREAIALLTRQFAGIYKVLRAVEASLPRRIFLPIVHFTDALGETFALPYQVCMQWKTFRLMLHALFHQRPGQSRVEMGNFLIMHAAGGRLLQEGSWNHAIKEGDHLEMSMILDGHFTTGDFCPFPSCQASLLGGEVSNGGITCSKCRRWVLLVERRMPPAVAPAERNTSEDDSREWNSEEEDLNEDRTDEKNQSPKENIVEDIELYRKVNVVRAQATASQPNRFNSGPEEWLACWREAQRADKVAEGLLRIRTILDLEFYDQISATLREVESTSRILRDLYDLFPFYRSRVPFIICYLNVIIPSLCRTLKEMTLYLEHENLPARAQWTLMSDRLSQQGGMTLAARFVMYVELLIQLVRLLSRYERSAP